MPNRLDQLDDDLARLRPYVLRWIAEASEFGVAARVLAAWTFTKAVVFGDAVAIAGGLNLGAADPPGEGGLTYAGDLQPERGGTAYTGYVVVPLQNALTSTEWDGDAKAADAVISLSAVFGAPAGIKAIFARLSFADETVGVQCGIGPQNGVFALLGTTQSPDVACSVSGFTPCDGDGNVYFHCSGEVDSVSLEIYGYVL